MPAHISVGICLVTEVLGHKVCALLSLVDGAEQLPKVAVPIYMPTCSI